MALRVVTIEVEQGSDYSNSWTFFSPDPLGSGDLSLSVPYYLTGDTLRMMVRMSQDPTSTQLLSLTSPSAGLALYTGTFTGGPALSTILAPNGFTVTITATQSLALITGVRYFDMFVDDPVTGLKKVYLAGPFIVGGTVTR